MLTLAVGKTKTTHTKNLPWENAKKNPIQITFSKWAHLVILFNHLTITDTHLYGKQKDNKH